LHANRRRYKRENYQALITYSEYKKTYYNEAAVHDKSLEGIRFESDIEIESKLPFSIIIPPHAGIVQASEFPTAYVARLKWCQKDVTRCNYTMGAELLFQGYVLNRDELYSTSGTCDLCGGKLSGQVYKTDKPLYLCLNCFKHLGGVSVMRFVNGNVISDIFKSLFIL